MESEIETFEQHPQVIMLHKDINDTVVTVIFRTKKAWNNTEHLRGRYVFTVC